MYFAKFHPVFPLLHAPTFRPSLQSSLLVLSICSIGSLFVGSSHAASQGLKVFETLNKAILSSVSGSRPISHQAFRDLHAVGEIFLETRA